MLGSAPKMIAFFIAIALLFAAIRDVTLASVARKDLQRTAIDVTETVARRHMDWAALRVGQPPYIIQDGVEDTIEKVFQQQTDIKLDRVMVRKHLQSTPAIMGVTLESNYKSMLFSILGESVVDIPVTSRAIEIIEAKDTSYPY